MREREKEKERKKEMNDSLERALWVVVAQRPLTWEISEHLFPMGLMVIQSCWS